MDIKDKLRLAIRVIETVVKYTLPEDNQTIFSSEFRLTIPTEEEFISVIENEKKNLELS